MVIRVILHERQLYCECCSLAHGRLDHYASLVQVNDFLHVSESESESLYIVYVSCMYAVELVEDFLQSLFLYADASILYRQVDMMFIVPCPYEYVERSVGLGLFHRIVHEVVYGVSEVYLVDIYL